MVWPMNATSAPTANSFQAANNTGRAEPASRGGGRSTAVFKRSFNIGTLNEQDRLAAQALLQRLISRSPARPRP